MRISDLTENDILAGHNWRLADPDSLWSVNNLPDLQIEATGKFCEDDVVVYSALALGETGSVTLMVLIKRVGDYETGGDYCELSAQGWRQVGLSDTEQFELTQEVIANPLEMDPSFDSLDHDHRKWHRETFTNAIGKRGR